MYMHSNTSTDILYTVILYFQQVLFLFEKDTAVHLTHSEASILLLSLDQ